MSLYNNLLNEAQTTAATPYQAYTGELVAPINAQQQTGVAGINQNANYALPYIQTAAGMAAGASQPITSADINQYVSPYTADVVNATQAQFNNQNAQQLEGVKGNAIAQGAMGGNREAIAEAETTNQQQLAQAPVIANLENQGYQTGLNTALTEQQALASGAYSLGNLGVAGQNAALTGANAQVGAGTLEQQTQQAQDQAQYQQYLNQLAYPFQTEQWLAGIGTGVGSQMGGTSSTTGPAPSQLAQYLGLGVAGAGMFAAPAGGTSAATGIYNALSNLARGGAVESHGVANREPTIPESHATLLAQQYQLLRGHRRVQMFPPGTRELPLPHGMARTSADGAVFHYDPKRISAAAIHQAAVNGHEHELLDLGPVSKHEIMHRIRSGEIPVAIVERHPDGTEVRAAAGTHLTAHRQYAAMERTKSPGHHLRIEDPRVILAHRFRAMGGAVPGFDGGGGVAYSTFGGGYGTPTTPYTGGHSWVPSMGISRGAGAPRPPNLPQQQSSAGQAQQIGALAKSLTSNSPNNASAYPVGTAPAVNSPLGVAPGQFASDAAIYRDGGRIGRYAYGGVANRPVHNPIMVPRGYADGGSPDGVLPSYFDDELAAPILHNAQDYDIATNPDAMADYGATASQAALAANPDFVPMPMPRPSGIVPAPMSIAADDTLPPEIMTGSSTQPRGVASPDYSAPLAFDTPTQPLSISPSTTGETDAGVARAASPKGVANDIGPALMAAGFGMMSSRSPFPGVAIGEGAMAGLETYSAEQKQEHEQALNQSKVDLEAKKLDQEAKQMQQRLAIETLPYSHLTAPQQADLDLKQRELNRQNLQPVKIGTDMSTGTDIYAVRDPSAPSGFRRIDASTFAAPLATPSGTGAPVVTPPVVPGTPGPTPGAAPAAIPPPTSSTATPPAVPSSEEERLPASSSPTAGDIPDNVKPEVLASLDPQLASQVKALDEGRMAFPTGFALKSPYWQNILRLVSNYDPSFDAVNYNARAKARADFTAGKSAQNITSFNTAIGHLDTLDKSVDALNNSAYPTWNKVANWAAVQTGDTKFQQAQKDFMAAKQAVTDELTRAFRGSGGNVHDIVGWEQTLNEADSPQALHQAVKTAVNLLQSRIEAVGDQYNRGMGTSHDPLKMLSPHAQATIDRLSGNAGASLPTFASPNDVHAAVAAGKLKSGDHFLDGNGVNRMVP
jgi:hypothetical protein